MRVVFSPRALNDLRDIQSYIARHNVTAAARVASAIRTSIEMLEYEPLLFPVHEDDIRRLNVGRYPYSVFYSADLEAETVTIHHIRHGHRRPPQFR